MSYENKENRVHLKDLVVGKSYWRVQVGCIHHIQITKEPVLHSCTDILDKEVTRNRISYLVVDHSTGKHYSAESYSGDLGLLEENPNLDINNTNALFVEYEDALKFLISSESAVKEYKEWLKTLRWPN